MKTIFSLLMCFLLLTACASPSAVPDIIGTDISDMHIDHGSEKNLDEDSGRLNESPRHHEWVEVKNGDKTIYTWVVYPERSDAAPVVLVIHENRGLNDWARSFADQVAEAGYIAVAPDLLSNFSDEFDRTSDFADEDAARDALYLLDPVKVQSDLKVVAEYAKSIKAGSGKLATAGFCWGGAKSFEFATESDSADAVMVFYGTSPEDVKAYENISSPVFGFYGGNDQRVNATIDRAQEAMSSLEKPYEVEIYEGAGHAFMKKGEAEDLDTPNRKARDAAFERMEEILEKL
ncbi:MAG: dienelactone hydrolase family protein [Candidatus Gracilibacteria bacterium]|nr:dienelactone hydrolase family protein [Candidatus Gracilibacteria bacterium]